VRENPDLCAGLDYLAARGLDALDPEYLGSLRVHGALPYYVIPGDKPIAIGPFPAILAALTEGGQGEPVALQRMWLEQDNDGLVLKIAEETLRKAVAQAKVTLDPNDDLPSRKLTAGGCGTAAVWMGRPTDTVVIAEGVETALSAVDAGFYAAASCGVSRMHVLAMAPGIKTVILAPDRQDVAETAALRAAQAYAAHGFAVRIASLPLTKREGYDLNDALREEGPEAVQALLDGAEPYVPPKAPAEPKVTSDADTSEQAVPSGLLDVPGAYGDLAHYFGEAWRGRSHWGRDARGIPLTCSWPGPAHS